MPSQITYNYAAAVTLTTMRTVSQGKTETPLWMLNLKNGMYIPD